MEIFLCPIRKSDHMNKRIDRHEIRAAYDRIKGDIRQTPLEFSPALSRLSGANVYLKMEHQQLTGSFKLRGVCNKVRSIDESDFQQPFYAASTGNHAAAFAHCARQFGFKGTLFLPETISSVKRKALEHFDVELVIHGKNSMEAEAKATETAKAENGILIHPYNDRAIIAGQGTIGVEIEKQLPDVNAVLAPIGGGGLISGLCSYFHNERVRVVGVQPEKASEMIDSIEKGFIVEPSTMTTISDATAGGIEANSLTFEICQNQLDGYHRISEKEIEEAILFMVNEHQMIIEAAAALPVAALLKSEEYKDQNVVLVLTGRKINPKLITQILMRYGNCNE
ncbi:pyridoxal-phosphate dependent enzyme [Prolixibacteraceae bacterium JC049]|nr:pyridoxal-phosphate dependent enzyme [Prolixibacteraceae bacterium JC049]